MSDRPPEYDPSPEFGWSLPPQESPLPPPVTVVPSQPRPMPPPAPPQTTGFGGPPGAYIPGPLASTPVAAIVPPPIPEPKPVWKQWWFIAAAVIALIGGGALIHSSTAGTDTDETLDTTEDTRDTDETSPTTPVETAVDSTIVEITIPDLTIPDLTVPGLTIPGIPGLTVPEIPDPTDPDAPGSSLPVGDLAVVGETITIDDGTMVRVNSVTHDAPPVQDFFTPDDGNVLTRIDFEVCAGSGGFSALNPFYWVGTLDDGTEAASFLFSFPIVVLQLAPGACAHSQIDLEAPADDVVATVGVRDALFELTAEWTTASNVTIDGPLVASTPVSAAAVGTTVALTGGGTATVRSVTPGSTPLEPLFPPDPGYQYVRIDAEVCAGTTAAALTDQNFFGATTDNRLGGASYSGSTFPAEPIGAGQCASGSFDLAIPDPGTIGDVILSNEQYVETARWRVG